MTVKLHEHVNTYDLACITDNKTRQSQEGTRDNERVKIALCI